VLLLTISFRLCLPVFSLSLHPTSTDYRTTSNTIIKNIQRKKINHKYKLFWNVFCYHKNSKFTGTVDFTPLLTNNLVVQLNYSNYYCGPISFRIFSVRERDSKKGRRGWHRRKDCSKCVLFWVPGKKSINCWRKKTADSTTALSQNTTATKTRNHVQKQLPLLFEQRIDHRKWPPDHFPLLVPCSKRKICRLVKVLFPIKQDCTTMRLTFAKVTRETRWSYGSITLGWLELRHHPQQSAFVSQSVCPYICTYIYIHTHIYIYIHIDKYIYWNLGVILGFQHLRVFILLVGYYTTTLLSKKAHGHGLECLMPHPWANDDTDMNSS